MGAVGYVVKLGTIYLGFYPYASISNVNIVHIPLNHALVGSA
jgi:hypothetical protein